MSLEYRSGRFFIAYYPQGRKGGKKRLPLPMDIQDRETAQRYHDEFVRKPSDTSQGYTVKDLWTEYMSWYQMHRAATTYKDINLAGNHFLKYMGHERVGSISIQHISLYKKMRLGDIKTKMKTNIHRSINKELAYFSGFLKYCRENYNVGQKFQITPLPYKRPDPVVLSPGEVKRLLSAMDNEPFYKALFLCLYSLGLRMNEARNIRAGDIDFGNMTIKVKEKGGGDKVLPIPDILGVVLRNIIDSGASSEASPLIFASPMFRKDGKARPIADVRKALKRACDRAGITKKVTPHTFRHTCLTHLTMAGINASIVQKYAGHKEISTTQYYVHIATNSLNGASSVIENILEMDDCVVHTLSET